MNILITGIHGRLGPHLVKLFHQRNVIYGLDFDDSEMAGVARIFTYQDLTIIPEVDAVIHVDGKYSEAKEVSEALTYFESNAGLTRKIYNWFARSTAKYFIYFSSIKAAAPCYNSGGALTEEMTPKPFGIFGESKLLGEKYILDKWIYGKKIYILRPAIIHDAASLGSAHLNLMYNWVKKGRTFPFGKFECRRSFTSVDNLCFVLKRMLEMDIPGGIYNVVDDDSLILKEIYEIMVVALHRKNRIWPCSKKLIRLVSRIGDYSYFGLDSFQYQKLSTDFCVSNEKIKKALGIRKLPVSVVEGFNRSVREYRSVNN